MAMQEALYWKKKNAARRHHGVNKRGGTISSSPCHSPMSSPLPSANSSPCVNRRRSSDTNSPLQTLKSALPDLLMLPAGFQMGRSGSALSLAASDGELETQGDEVIRTKGGNYLDVPGRVPSQKNVGRVSSWAVGFERLLQDEQGLDCFTQFLKKEFSEENIMFWIACEKMGKIQDKVTLEKYASEIYEIYLSPKATSPVNLEGQCRELIEEAIKSPTPEMFRSQQQQIFKLMKFDSYSRFLKSKMYQDCVLAEMAGEPLPISSATKKPSTPVDEKANKKKSWFGTPFRKT